MNSLQRVAQLGQSPWLDYLSRDLLVSGRLKHMIEEDGIRGLTSNPTIFEKAIIGSDQYDEDIRVLLAEGRSPSEIFEALAVADVQSACDIFLDQYEALEGRDGLVSIEVNPELAYSTIATIEEASRLWNAVNRPNAMIKIPGTLAGLEAIRESLARGINVNVTLLFAVSRYVQVIEAFFDGLERRLERGESIARLASVASFFVSRVDSKVDQLLDGYQSPEAQRLRGKIAIANAAKAYRVFQRQFTSLSWENLVPEGVQPQRPLWASTSTKDPHYPDTHYVEALVARHTVNTMPPETLDAFRDHGESEIRISRAMERSPRP